MSHWAQRGGELHAEDVPLSALAARYGTPLYVYSRAGLRACYRAFESAFAARDSTVCYAVKANGNLAVLAELARLGAGFDIVSGGELARVLRAGGDARRVVFSGVGKSPAELEAALAAGIGCFNVESFAELEALDAIARAAGRRAPVALRFNPDVDGNTHPHIATGRAQHKFGIPAADVRAVCARAAGMASIRLIGLACHIGSQILTRDAFAEAARLLAGQVRALEADGHALEHVDMGGGLGLSYGRFEPPSVAAYAEAVLAPLADLTQRLFVEPGRAIAGPAGLLLCRVLYVKDSGSKRFAIVDAGMTDLMRPALYGAWQEITTVRERTGVQASVCDVVGPVCESADFLGLDRELAVAPGDLLAVRDAGAYGFAMSSQYNARPRPAEVMVDGERAHLVRARESFDDLMRGESVLQESPQ